MVFFFLSPYMMLGMLLAGVAMALVVGGLALAAPRLVRGPPRSLWGLKSSMSLTAAAVILGSLGALYLVLYYFQASPAMLYGAIGFMTLLMVLQWLFSPSIINAIYHTREPRAGEEWLVDALRSLARRAGFSREPKIVVADVDMPNAFAYGSPLKGNYVAVTRGLLETMPRDEVVAVLGHELGHLKHRDVMVILALSLLPVALYYLGKMLLYWGWLAGGDSRRGNAVLYYMGLGLVLVIVGFLFQFLVTHFNRLREYYADAYSAGLTGRPRSLQRALARLYVTFKSNPEVTANTNQSMAMLFFANYLINTTGGMYYEPYEPLWPRRKRSRRVVVEDIDEVVERLMGMEESPLVEIFSTHPPIPKRLRFLEGIRASLEEVS